MARLVLSPGGTVEPFVIGFMGQSDYEYIMDPAAFFRGSATPPSIANPNCSIVRSNDAANTVTETTINNTTIAAGSVNVAMSTLAEFLGWRFPSRTFVFLDLSVSGTSRQDLYDDADTDREWGDFQRVLDYVTTTYNKDPDLILEHWYASDGAFLSNFGTNFAPFYLGQQWDGSVFTIGTTHPTIPARGDIDHCLWDAEAAPHEKGRGVFTRDKTKLIMHRRANYTGGFANYAADHAGLEAFCADPRVPALPLASEPVHMITDSGGWHVLTSDDDGNVGWARILMESIARAVGQRVLYPSVASYEQGPAGAYVDVLVNLPNGGDLTTFLALEGRTFSMDLELRQPVVGAEIRRVGDAESARQPVWPSAETGKAAAYRGTVTLVDAGSGSPRRGRIRVTPEVAFTNGDMVYFNWLNANTVPGGTLQWNADPLKPWMGYAVETVPNMRNEAASYPHTGVPVKLFPAPYTVTGI